MSRAELLRHMQIVLTFTFALNMDESAHKKGADYIKEAACIIIQAVFRRELAQRKLHLQELVQVSSELYLCPGRGGYQETLDSFREQVCEKTH